MKLLPMHAQRFFRLFDLLSVYAHERLHIASDEEFWSGEPPRGIGEVAQRDTMDAVWSDSSIIEDYVRENPHGLDYDELDLVASWSYSYTDMFYVSKAPQGSLVFYAQGYAFAVCGMSLNLEDMLGELPTVAQTTLLPFGRFVVYAQAILQMPVHIGDTMRTELDRGVEEALSQGKVISSGTQLIEVAPTLREQRIEREIEDFRHDIEMQERSAGPHEGQHVSVLNGMDDEERDRAVLDHIRQLDAEDRQHFSSPASTLESWCTPGPVRSDLASLLATEELPDCDELLDDLEETESFFMIGDDTSGKLVLPEEIAAVFEEERRILDEEGAQALLMHRFSNPDSLRYEIVRHGLRQIRNLRRLYEYGGSLRFIRDDVTTLRDLPQPTHGLCYLFQDGDVFHFIMPDETYRSAAQLDWDETIAEAEHASDLILFVSELVELRGMVNYVDAIISYMASHPDDPTPPYRMSRILMNALWNEELGADILKTSDESYLLHYELMASYRRRKGADPYDGPAVERGELDDMLKGLLRQQEGKEPRVPTAEMLAEESLFHWKEKQPPARAMRAFLDQHVPVEADEYFFADKVMEDLIEDAKWGAVKDGVRFFFDTLEDNGFIPDESQVQQLINLWQNLCNGLPIWPNNGWSPNELMSRSSGRRVFYNPDGSVMRVGRNDPCPCGSGKKYKRCCGR